MMLSVWLGRDDMLWSVYKAKYNRCSNVHLLYKNILSAYFIHKSLFNQILEALCTS